MCPSITIISLLQSIYIYACIFIYLLSEYFQNLVKPKLCHLPQNCHHIMSAMLFKTKVSTNLLQVVVSLATVVVAFSCSTLWYFKAFSMSPLSQHLYIPKIVWTQLHLCLCVCVATFQGTQQLVEQPILSKRGKWSTRMRQAQAHATLVVYNLCSYIQIYI